MADYSFLSGGRDDGRAATDDDAFIVGLGAWKSWYSGLMDTRRPTAEMPHEELTGSGLAEKTGPGAMQGPRTVARILLAFVVCSVIFSDYWTYSRQFHFNPGTWLDLIEGTGGAPMQYRIGILKSADFLQRHGHMGLRHALTLIDFFCSMVACYLLLSVLEHDRVYRGAGQIARWFGALSLVFLVQYYFSWMTWYQRPETMASTAVMAATLWLLKVKLPLSKTAATLTTSAAMLVLAAMQGFIRADVAFVAHLGIFLVCLTFVGNGLSLTRGVQMVVSGLGALIAGGIQYYLMHVVYPHATYGTVPVFFLPYSVVHPLNWISFLLFMPAWVWLATRLAKRGAAGDAPGIAIFAGSAMYLILWVTVGNLDEVRIFLPYMAALIPLMCVCAMRQFLSVKVAA
jgi:hypothetical protein